MLGYELEFMGASLRDLRKPFHSQVYSLRNSLPDYNSFHLKEEFDITTKYLTGGELISPIYLNLNECLHELSFPLQVLQDAGAYIPRNSDRVGFHVHYQNDFLHTREQKRLFIQFLYAFQAEIFEIAKGLEERIRFSIVPYANPITYDDMIHLNVMLENKAFQQKVFCIRFCVRLNTIEFRYFNSSLDADVLRIYLYLVEGICKYFKSFSKVNQEMILHYANQSRDDILDVDPERKKILRKIIKKVA